MSEAWAALVGGVVGGVLTLIGQFSHNWWEARRRRYAEVVELYAVWIPEMRQRLWHHTSETWQGSVSLTVVNLKLDFYDPIGQAFRVAVVETLPHEVRDPARYEAMKEAQQMSTWYDPFEWPEFDIAMSRVIEHVRGLNPDHEFFASLRRRF